MGTAIGPTRERETGGGGHGSKYTTTPYVGFFQVLRRFEYMEPPAEAPVGLALGVAAHEDVAAYDQYMPTELGRVCVFCGSNTGARAAYLAQAQSVGRLLASAGIGLVYGGGRVGLMGALADAALGAHGTVIGVIPEALVAAEVAHGGLADLRVVPSMHERKKAMADLADAFVALPGGFGTFDELFEIVTWAQLGFHAKPIGLLNVDGYFDPLLEMVDHAVAEGFVAADHARLLYVDDDPGGLLDRLRAHTPSPRRRKWRDRDET